MEGRGSDRLFLQEDEKLVESNNQRRPVEGTEAVEVPWSRPFAPWGCPKIVGWVIQQVTVPGEWSTGGQEATEANGKWARRRPSRRV